MSALADRLRSRADEVGPVEVPYVEGINETDVRAAADAVDEVAVLRAWKREAMEVLAGWDEVWDALGRPGPLGSSRAPASRDEVEAMKQGVAERNSLIGWLIMAKSCAANGMPPVWPMPPELEELFQQLSVSIRDDWDDWRWRGITRTDQEGS